MNQRDLDWIAAFIWNIADDVLRDLKSRAKQQQLKADFETYLDGFSPNVQEILDKFKFRNQLPTLVDADIRGQLIEKFLEKTINLSPAHVYDHDGSMKLSGLDNHGMGTIFEELIRRFNEENNEEAGEHFTPRDVVKLMSRLIFQPVAGQIESGTYLVYDGACGTGGMLTVAEETLAALAAEQGAVEEDVEAHNVKLTASRKKQLANSLGQRDERAAAVIRKRSKLKEGVDPERERLYGRYHTEGDGGTVVVEYEPDSELRDTEQVPLLEEGGIAAFFRREVLPHVADAWIDESKTVVGYEVLFAKHFYKYRQPRELSDIVEARLLPAYRYR